MRVSIHHLGLGDLLVLAGALNWWSKHGEIVVPAWRHNAPSAGAIFEGNPKIEIRPIDSEREMFELEGERLYSGYYAEDQPPREGEGFDSWFYAQLGVDIEEKWNSFPLKFDHLPRDPGTPLFIHVDEPRGYIIDPHRIPSGGGIILDGKSNCDMPITHWAGPIIRAGEIHVINSAFLHLCEALPLRPEQPKFLHRYPRPWRPIDMPRMRHNWTILD